MTRGMEGQFLDRIFRMGKLYLQWLDSWEFVKNKWVMTGLREVKRRFGILRHKCPLCQAKMSYYNIVCQAQGASGEPTGTPMPLSLYTRSGFLPGALLPLGHPQFGVCPVGHRTARIFVNDGGGDGFNGYLVHLFKMDDKMEVIASP